MDIDENIANLTSNPIKVMIVDDSKVIRNILEREISKDHALKMVMIATNGQEAVDAIVTNEEIEVVLLDIQMPIMDGLQAIPLLLRAKPNLKIIMVSSLTVSGAKHTMQALALGAADYIEKPNSSTTIETFSNSLLLKIRTFGMAIRGLHNLRQIAAMTEISVMPDNSDSNSVMGTIKHDEQILLRTMYSAFHPEIVAIASSTGGPRALLEVLSGFSENFINSKVILITQHIKKDFVDLLVENINSISKLRCKIATDQEEIKLGMIYLAPSDFHLELRRHEQATLVRLSSSDPENFCRPSADPMFRSLAKLSKNILAIVLTGIGKDGTKGAQEIVDKGGVVIAQDEETSVVWGMPGSVAHAGLCSAVLPLQRISSYVEKSFG